MYVHILISCSVDLSKKQVEMSLRSETVNKQALTFGDLEEGKKVDGKVKKVEDFGIFIQIEGSRLSGLCHKSEVRGVFHSAKIFIVILLDRRQQRRRCKYGA